jgi:hypothetical protein
VGELSTKELGEEDPRRDGVETGLSAVTMDSDREGTTAFESLETLETVPINCPQGDSDASPEADSDMSEGMLVAPMDTEGTAGEAVMEALRVFIRFDMTSSALGMDGEGGLETASLAGNSTPTGVYSVLTESFSSSLTEVASR